MQATHHIQSSHHCGTSQSRKIQPLCEMCQPRILFWVSSILLVTCVCIVIGSTYWILKFGKEDSDVSLSGQSYSLSNVCETLEVREEMYLQEKQNCEIGWKDRTDWCPIHWDGIMCWPSSPPGELSLMSCPDYIPEYDPQFYATKECMSNGSWYQNKSQDWTNYSNCSSFYAKEPMEYEILLSFKRLCLLEKHLPTLNWIFTIGNATSILMAGLAFIVLHYLVKEETILTFLHKNLFISFALRGCVVLLKNAFLKNGLSLSLPWNDNEKFDESMCRAFIILWNYIIISSYWITSTVGFVTFYDVYYPTCYFIKKMNKIVYLLISWGLPAVAVVVWATLTIVYDDADSWTMNIDELIYSPIIKKTIIATVIFNFAIFDAVVMELLLVTYIPGLNQIRRLSRNRWIIKVLCLVPFLSVHHIVFLMIDWTKVDEHTELKFLYYDEILTSFQGWLITILCCLPNPAVTKELYKLYKTTKYLCQRMAIWLLRGERTLRIQRNPLGREL